MHTATSGPPTWVYLLLAGLIYLGVRRLRTRELPVAVALIAPVAFLIWSIAGAHGFAGRAGTGAALGIWLAGAALGALSGTVLPDPRSQRLPGGRVRQPGTTLPLILYLGVFAVRFACGAWAAIRPEQALLADGLAIAVSAAMTARLAVAVARWRPVGTG